MEKEDTLEGGSGREGGKGRRRIEGEEGGIGSGRERKWGGSGRERERGERKCK